MKYWIYIFDDDIYGIVKANTEEEAKQKVLKAYIEHGGYESDITEDTVINSLAYHRTVEEIEELEASLQAMTLRKELLNTFIKEKEDDEMKSQRIAEMKAKK